MLSDIVSLIKEIDWYATISLVTAIIALLVSIIANRKANDINIRQLEIEEQREKEKQALNLSAKLSAKLIRSNNRERLVLINSGNSEARNLRMALDGRPYSEHNVVVDSLPEMVGPNSKIGCAMSFTYADRPQLDIKVVWDDDLQNDRVYRTILRIEEM